jgi:hypothetical protein
MVRKCKRNQNQGVLFTRDPRGAKIGMFYMFQHWPSNIVFFTPFSGGDLLPENWSTRNERQLG